MEKQVHITITCDKYYTADFLRQLANEIEYSDEREMEFETFRGIAVVKVD